MSELNESVNGNNENEDSDVREVEKKGNREEK